MAYESPNARVPGRHRIDVRVTRPDTRVYARRGYIVPRVEDEAPAGIDRNASTTLTDLLQRVVPQGDLGLRLLVTPLLADGRQGRAFATVQVDPASAQDQDVTLALVTFDERGAPANQQTLRFARTEQATTRADQTRQTGRGTHDGPAWEAAVELTLTRGTHQLRVAAITADGTRHGLVVDRIVIAEPGRDLQLGPPMLLGVDATTDAASLHPTLQRAFDVGHPLAVQSEVAGRPVSDGKMEVTARIERPDGTVVREGTAAVEPGAKRDRARATAVVHTHGLIPGTYALVTEARGPGRGEPVRHAIPISLRAAETAPSSTRVAGGTDAVTGLRAVPANAGETRADRDADADDDPARAAAATRTAPAVSAPTTVTPLPVAHGPASLFDRGGTHVIRTAAAWAVFWKHLPTRQAAPDIDFDRVTLLAVVLDGDDAAGQQPRIEHAGADGSDLVVHWRAVAADASLDAGTSPRPFVVVGITDYDGPVRFERVE